MPVAIEQHVEWITDCIAHMREHGIDCCEAAAEAAEKWGDHVNTAAHATLLPLATHSWYLGANARQAARVHALRRRHGSLPRHLRRCRCKGLRGFRDGPRQAQRDRERLFSRREDRLARRLAHIQRLI
jgi:hypothetical protein